MAAPFWQRWFSRDARRALAAEARGDFELAAEYFAHSNDRAGCVRMHLARAARAVDPTDRIAALRTALHWAGDDVVLLATSRAALGRALMQDVERAAPDGHRDRERMREAAGHLFAGGEHAAAAEVYLLLDDLAAASTAFSAAGMVEQLEQVLEREATADSAQRAEASGFAAYESAMHLGDRDAARNQLVELCRLARAGGKYAGLLRDLDTRLITNSRVEIVADDQATTFVCRPAITIGRDATCEFPLRSMGASRQHARIAIAGDAATPTFVIEDLQSRNGILINGFPIVGAQTLIAGASIRVGTDTSLSVQPVPGSTAIALRIDQGSDKQRTLVCMAKESNVSLELIGLGARLSFRSGRPHVLVDRDQPSDLRFNGRSAVANSWFQLVRGDVISTSSTDFEVR